MIKINKTLGLNYIMEPDDVQKIKGALNRAGYYDIPDYGLTPYPDVKMFDGIKSFQKDQNLKVDGIIKPDGPTLIAL